MPILGDKFAGVKATPRTENARSTCAYDGLQRCPYGSPNCGTPDYPCPGSVTSLDPAHTKATDRRVTPSFLAALRRGNEEAKKRGWKAEIGVDDLDDLLDWVGARLPGGGA